MDDTSQSLNAELSLEVRAGQRYFLLVDHWQQPGDPLPAPTIVTLFDAIASARRRWACVQYTICC